jgi:2-methylcitrate dehydratase PrpD
VISDTHRLAQFVLQTRSADLPEGVIEAAGKALVDTIGCALAGVDEPVCLLARKWVVEMGSAPHACIWGTTLTASWPDAAFLNGIASHALDFDDNLPSQRGHPSTTVFPAIFAAAQSSGQRSGREILAAYAIGVEVSGKLGRAVGPGHYVRGFHATATIGIFGATAAAARLLQLTGSQLAHAWGLAASQMSGLLANFGTMAKPFHAGHAARSALSSAMLAQAGFTANDHIFDGSKSMLSTYRGDGATEMSVQLARLGAPWDVLDPGIFVKRWPCCLCSHRPVAGVLDMLVRHEIRPGDITAIDIGFPPGTDAGLLDGLPQTGLAGKFSVEYAVAIAVLEGDISLRDFTDDMLKRDDVQALMHRVRRYALPDATPGSASIGHNQVSIATTRGTFAQQVNGLPGSPSMPLSGGELDAKFLDCARPTLGETRAIAALQLARDFSEQPNCNALLAALRTG